MESAGNVGIISEIQLMSIGLGSIQKHCYSAICYYVVILEGHIVGLASHLSACVCHTDF